MLRKLPALLLPLVLMCPSISHGSSDEPESYDECIIDAMKGVSSDVAARAIIESCRNLFPASHAEAEPPAAEPAPAAAEPARAAIETSNSRALTADELDRVSAKAKVFGDSYRVTVSNGNPDLTLTEVTIAVWDAGDPASGRMEHSEVAQIGPQASAEIRYTVRYRGDESGWRWAVVAARGVD